MLLLEAERAWAAAHEIKAQMDEDGSVNANKRRHMLRRFAKAHKQAQVLEAGCARIGGARRRTEAAAYVDLLAALELFERGHQVEIAAGHFIRARRALDALANVGPASSKSACRSVPTCGALHVLHVCATLHVEPCMLAVITRRALPLTSSWGARIALASCVCTANAPLCMLLCVAI